MFDIKYFKTITIFIIGVFITCIFYLEDTISIAKTKIANKFVVWNNQPSASSAEAVGILEIL